jgi:hypothetical protein
MVNAYEVTLVVPNIVLESCAYFMFQDMHVGAES